MQFIVGKSVELDIYYRENSRQYLLQQSSWGQYESFLRKEILKSEGFTFGCHFKSKSAFF